jgi:EpsI family protein
MKKRFFLYTTISAILLLSTAVCLLYIDETQKVIMAKDLNLFPERLGEWRGANSAINDKILAVLGVEDYLMRRYSGKDGPDIWLYVGYYESQREGDIIHSPKHCLQGSGWNAVSNSRERIYLAKGPARTVEINRYLVQNGTKKDLVAYFYYSGGRVVANDYLYRLLLIWDLIFKKRTDGALVKISCPVSSDEIDTWNHLVRFFQEFFPALNEHFIDKSV